MSKLKHYFKQFLSILINISLLEFFIGFFEKTLFYLTKVLFYKEWHLNKKIPTYFKHKINLNLWRFRPEEWTFVLRGVYVREQLCNNQKLLDLCCGDGSYSFLFFSDICSHIDAIDYDKSAIAYACNNFYHNKINYKVTNILTQQFPSNNYDVIVWNAGICYFDITEIHVVLKKIIISSNNNMKLIGMLPKANGHIDHKTEFNDTKEVIILLKKYFENIEIKECIENSLNNAVNFYFTATNPKKLNL